MFLSYVSNGWIPVMREMQKAALHHNERWLVGKAMVEISGLPQSVALVWTRKAGYEFNLN